MESSSTVTPSITHTESKEDMKKKRKRRKKATAEKKQDELKQMEERQILFQALSGEESENLENFKVREKSQEASESKSITEKINQISMESSSCTKDNQQNIKEFQTSSETLKWEVESNELDIYEDENEEIFYYIKNYITLNNRRIIMKNLMDTYQVFDSKKSRKNVRNKAIQVMRQLKYAVMVAKPGKFAKKYASSEPYHLFFTRIENSKETYNQQFSITFSEILDRSLGEIVNSLHLTFMLDVGWLYLQYLLAGQCTDMTIFYNVIMFIEKLSDNIMMIELPRREFSIHHTKIMILQYKDNGIRVVVSTANSYSNDWKNRTQGLWISPHLPRLPESANSNDGESPTGFKKDLERYLSKYEEPALTQWIWAVQKADFSAVNVFFVASVPGNYTNKEANFWGYKRLEHVLSHHVTLPSNASDWSIVAQSSSIGNFGRHYDSWLLKYIIRCMSKETSMGLKNHPNFQFIFPSIQNYEQSFDRQDLNCCLPYSEQTHSKQKWLNAYLYQWKAMRTKRDRAMPHMKSYTRISPDLRSIPWFVLTSANLGKSAWGIQRENYYIANYEAGVIFIPKFITGATTFPIKDEEDPTVPVFPIPYDLPLIRYQSCDRPFVVEYLHSL